MAIKNHTGPSVLIATNEVIRRFAEFEHTAQERPVSPKRLEYLKNEAAAGRLRSPEWAWVHCKYNGKNYRLNGNHTKRVLSDLPMENRPSIIMNRFECDTLEEVAELFSTYDSKESARTTNDVNRAVFESCEALQGYPSRLAAVVVSAIQLASQVERGVEISTARNVTAYERAKLAASQADFLQWVRSNFAFNTGRIFMRASVVAAMLLTYRKDASAALAFWIEVRDGTNPNPNAPSRVLQSFLMTRSVASSSYTVSGRTQATPREMAVKSLHAWNAFRRNEPTRLNYYADKPIPKVA